VLNRVAPTALPRSSIIISDEALSAETNYRTEFVAVLNNHPQGGFVTRSVASSNIYRDEGFGSFPRGWNSQPGNPARNGNRSYRRDPQGW
jgi:hypothetical protein